MSHKLIISIVISTLSLSAFAQEKMDCDSTPVLKKEARVIFQENHKIISGNVKDIFKDDSVEIKTDKLKTVYKKISEIQLAVACKNDVTAQQHVLYPLGQNRFFTAHVREVFADGTARLVNDRFQEVFVSTKDLGVSKTQVENVLKGSQAQFEIDNKITTGKIIEVYSNKKVLLADDHSGKRAVRNFDQISPAK